MLPPTKLYERQIIGEVMDQPGLEVDQHRDALNGLSRINKMSRASSVIWKPLQQLAQQSQRGLRVLDLATGAGDLPIELWLRGKRAGFSLHVEGCDISPTAVQFATEKARENQADVRFFQLDLLAEPLPRGFDVILCSLFLHHLDNESVVELFDKIRGSANQLLIASDLRRCYAGYLLASAATRLLSRSRIVHVDGPLSVRAAFTKSEIRELAQQAGMVNICLTNRWPYRFLLTWHQT